MYYMQTHMYTMMRTLLSATHHPPQPTDLRVAVGHGGTSTSTTRQFWASAACRRHSSERQRRAEAGVRPEASGIRRPPQSLMFRNTNRIP